MLDSLTENELQALWPYLNERERAEIDKLLRPKTAQQTLLGWTKTHRPELKVGLKLDFGRYPFLVQMHQMAAQRLAVRKAAQQGVSEYLISYATHACDQRDATVLYLFPTDTAVSDFSRDRFGGAIAASPYLQSIVVSGAARGADSVTLKRVRDRFLYLRGAQVKPDGKAAQIKSVAADIVIYDEVDEMDPRALDLGQKRLGASPLAEERFVSTPTYPNVGIDAIYKRSDQRAWHVRCTACGERQPLTIDHLVTEWDALNRPKRWHGDTTGRPFCACRKCGRELDRLGPGEWVAAYPHRALVGYHLTKLHSPNAVLWEAGPDGKGILNNLLSVDAHSRQEAWNQDLGLPFTPSGGKLTAVTLNRCRREYTHVAAYRRTGNELVAVGADVGSVLHVSVRCSADAETGERRQLWAGEVDTFTELAAVLRRYDANRCVIDALPETRKAREFQAAFPGVVWLAYYLNQAQGSKRVEPVVFSESDGVANIDRTRALDETLGMFYVAGESGAAQETSNTLPANAHDLADYYNHMTSSTRVLESGAQGVKVARYVASGPDHFLHAENYCAMAFYAPAPTSGWARGAG